MNTSDILRHCECGMCGHQNESDCLSNECECCYNFHIRSRKELENNNLD